MPLLTPLESWKYKFPTYKTLDEARTAQMEGMVIIAKNIERELDTIDTIHNKIKTVQNHIQQTASSIEETKQKLTSTPRDIQ